MPEPTSDAVQLAFGRILRDAALLDRLTADPEATLAELGVDAAARERLLGRGVSRLLAYNTMVFGRILRTIREFSPRATAIAGERVAVLARTWLAESGSPTPYLRELPAEFFAWARPHWAAAIARGELPAWLLELFEHELEQRALIRDPHEPGQPGDVAVDLERGMASNPTARLIHREYAVHRLPQTIDPAALPEVPRGGFTVLAWRDRSFKPRFLELRPRHAELLGRLLAGQSLRDALLGACALLGETLDDVILGDAAVTLAEWCDQHVLLGGQSSLTE